ncbi:MAG: hypothetical protein U5K27_02885 [Desulfotignum sp.]|nr:hypothetical protein [Desulfotignum sp.]
MERSRITTPNTMAAMASLPAKQKPAHNSQQHIGNQVKDHQRQHDNEEDITGIWQRICRALRDMAKNAMSTTPSAENGG